MSRVKEWLFKSHGMELEEDFYSFDYAEELSGYQDPNELLAALKQKEEEVILAAELGNALLLENRQLKEENDKLHEQYSDKLEELEQSRHELRVKLDSCETAWENQVVELERDVQELTIQTQRLNQALTEAERCKKQTQREHADETNRLKEQLNKALEAERVLTAELQVFKQSFHQQGRSGPRDEELISALKEQVARLSQKNLSLEQRLEAVCQENAGLQDSLASLHKRLVLQEEQGRQRTQQLVEAEKEVEVSRGRNQQLQEQVEQLQEEISMQESGRSEASLLSELEQSFSNMSWSQDKEQVKEEVLSVLKVLLPLTDQERALDSLRQENLDGALLLLRTTAHRLACDRAPQELNAPIVGSVRENADLIQELQDQNSKLMAENSELKTRVENSQEREVTQQAIRDRDEAIAKKNAMEKELLRCKTDMMSLNNQLLEAIHRKLELSQELEAWQDDIQVILNQQLQSQQLSETGLRKTRTNRLPFLNWSSAPELEHRRASTPCTTSSSTSEKTQAPWKGWLKRVKMGQEGL
ncbi:BICD family-like cargo adapter 1 isoform X1 [Conger conger]|uniref:BICD family-like cargo adapter 1 isoform X1 n=1 Tax=Conger conger TaxID=82655 RepID=UPI002A5B01F6|nr:BICD family-like cargo adapter 1 isoform X1 [Conger conger]